MINKKKNPLIEIKSLINRIENKTTLFESEKFKQEEEFKEVIKQIINNLNSLNTDIIDFHFRDLRFSPKLKAFGEKPVVKESFGDYLPVDDVIRAIRYKYNLSPDFAFAQEGYNGIKMYLIIAKIGENAHLIEEDMVKMGYFICSMYDIKINNKTFQVMQCEPMSQTIGSKTDYIKTHYEYLYHWTPQYNIESVMKNGLIPSHQNYEFFYPPRIYFSIENDLNIYSSLYKLGEELCKMNKDKRNDGNYILLEITLDGLNIDLFYDPNSPIGVYTEENVPSQFISIKAKKKFDNIGII